MISLWWSFILTVIGATGILLAYRSYTAYIGPAVGLAIQVVWVAYAVASQQWWFILGALVYGSTHVYGIAKRRRERRAADVTAEIADGLESVRFTERARDAIRDGLRNA